jgi:hypothetical protein
MYHGFSHPSTMLKKSLRHSGLAAAGLKKKGQQKNAAPRYESPSLRV